ncbi:leucine--tRNA ligase [Candidatus Paracaedibacter symbiosus]|uniref:leucine--tRNA ligase n=1 Tax=Candidatus Paracaedibacter symbiosus TaxID=244582 RepID=UPI000509AA04|nr:leucine--tRNA ligase [Candidatus Paracaedibacter symbiosus]
MAYPFRDIEEKWQQIWQEENSYRTENTKTNKPKAYILEMFPYPSGKLHMGHVRNYSIGDTIARFKRAQGCEVLHPMGWDAFGLPAENAAVQNSTSPAAWTVQNIAAMKAEFKSLGFGFDWERELASCMPEYYGLEQKIFLDFYKKGLAYRTESWVNWDPVDHCVLANEQVINGRGWRSGALVEKRKLMQWSLKITNYSEELLEELSALTGWPEKVVKMQENWIGRSEGAFIQFEINDFDEKLNVFTTRPETLFGASFCAIAPTHPIAEKLANTNAKLAAFIEECQHAPTTEEALSTGDKKGFDTHLKVVHPFVPGKTLPLFVANFVLMDYGTGALFACPAHDERDHDFAKKYNLPIIQVVAPESTDVSVDITQKAYTGPGKMINSGFLDGLSIEEARSVAIQKLEAQDQGKKQITYRLRDWCVSRQRYWGCPIPVIHCDHCGTVPVPDADLPVRLPEDVEFNKTGNPLDHHPTWKQVKCPKCENDAIRETDTFDTFFESSWYFLRFCDTKAIAPLNKEAVDKWMPVDWYIGGIEHAVLHLLYARFFTKALRDCGYITISEPFKNLLTQGMVCHQTYKDENGKWLYPEEVMRLTGGQYVTVDGEKPVTVGRSEKMSKSKKNLVDPQSIIDTYGADAARLFTLSDTPPDRDFDWSDEGVEGAWRYLNRLWRLIENIKATAGRVGEAEASLMVAKKTHQMLKKITQNYERNGFNKIIAFARELTRDLENAVTDQAVSHQQLTHSGKVLIQVLFPLVPHITSELWQQMGETALVIEATWPEIDVKLATTDEVTIAVQVNGKMRGAFIISSDSDEASVLEEALKLPTVQKDMNGRPIRRSIVIPNRIVNLVV